MRYWSKPACRRANLRTDPSLLQANRYLPRHERWQATARLHLHALAPSVRAWIALRTSLTAQLAAHARGSVTVRVLSERFDRFLPAERAVLNSARGRVREVQLEVAGCPYVVARTVFPMRTALSANRALLRLGDRALGSLLFGVLRAPAVARHHTRLTPQSALWRALRSHLPQEASYLWARRAVHLLQGQPLLVTEIFLPALWSIPTAQEAVSGQTLPALRDNRPIYL